MSTHTIATQTEPIWEVIDKMNKEFSDLEDEHEMLKECFDTYKDMMHHKESLYQKVIDNLMFKVIQLSSRTDDSDDEEIDVFDYSKKKKEWVGITEHMRIEQSVKRLNDEDWNEDGGYLELKYDKNDGILTIDCNENEMDETDDDSD
jgi:hypothetical protein